MKKYRINYSVTIEAETQQDAVNIFFDSVPQGGESHCIEHTERFESLSAQEMFDECDGETEEDLIEQLRFFCSCVNMRERDWFDIEKYFDAVISEREILKKQIRDMKRMNQNFKVID